MTYSVINPDIYKTFKDGDDFEHIVDNHLIETHSDDPHKKEYLLSLPRREKRLKSLSLRTKDLYEWKTLVDKITGSRVSNVEHLKQIISDFREFIKRAKVEDKLFGEVMTPLDELARPMVDLVEKYDDDFWKTPKKVLDSSAGIGTFLVICAAKFMNGLKNYSGLEDPEVRFKFIVENCLYYGELQIGNVSLWQTSIDPYDEYKTNTFWGSFISEDFNRHKSEVWKVDNWDLIIQNPPYNQVDKEVVKNKKGSKIKTQPIWNKFVDKSIYLLKEGGYMVMVHPGGWKDLDGIFKETQNLLKERQVLELNINDERKGFQVFGETTSFDYYILKNVKNYTKTKIVSDGYEKLADISKMDFIPSSHFDIYDRILSKDDEEKCLVIHSYSSYETRKEYMSREKTNTNIYPCVYTVQKDETINLFYSNTNKNGHFGVPKVIWSNGKASTPIVDKSGEYGLTQFAYAIVDDVENLENIKRAMCSDKFQTFMKSCDMNSGNRFNRKVLSMFKKDFWKEFI
jgi:hypothetical protein